MNASLPNQIHTIPPMSELEREGSALSDSMSALDKRLAELGSRLAPVMAPQHPIGSGTDCPQLSPLSDIGRLLRTRTEHVNAMSEAVDNLLSRLAI